jgi:hypothetical protein
MSKLYYLNMALEQISAAIDELYSAEEITEEIEEQVSALVASYVSNEADFQSAAVALARGAKRAEGEAKAISEEIARLQARRDSRKRQAEKFRTILRAELIARGVDKVKDPLATISVRQGAPILQYDFEALPETFVKVEKKPQIAEIRKYLKEKGSCEFARFIPNPDQVLSIR